MPKNYKIKKTKDLIKKLKPYWVKFKKLEDEYYEKIFEIEKEMSRKLKIKDLEIFFCDGEAVGVGSYCRNMELIHRKELS